MQLELNILGQDSCHGGNGGKKSCSSGCQCSGQPDGLPDLESRRGFLQNAATVALGGLSLTFLPVAASTLGSVGAGTDSVGGAGASDAKSKEVLFGFLVDTEKCIGAGKCLTACRTENNVPEGFVRTWVERYVHYTDGRVQIDLVPEAGYESSDLPAIEPEGVERAYFVPKLCNQCVDPPCNQVCPVNAAFESPEGISLVDSDLCIGCAYCVQACPYGVRFINPETNNADKCTWCYHRIMRDESPACVEACPVGARLFGRLDDPDSEISQRLAKVPTHVLKEYLGTHPRLQYVGISSDVI